MEPQGIREGPPQLYSIPRDQFVHGGTNVTNVLKYSYPNTVIRDNFMDYWRTAFSRSRGSGALLWAQCEWLKKNYGFDYQATISNYLNSGGSSTLSNEEFVGFASDFRKIPTHIQYNDDGIKTVLDRNLGRLANAADPGDDRDLFLTIITDAEIDSCKTKGELFAAIDTKVRNKKNAVSNP